MKHANKRAWEILYNKLVDDAYNDGFADAMEAASRKIAQTETKDDLDNLADWFQEIAHKTRVEEL